MVRGDRRRGELLALEVGERVDARTISYNERFVDARDRSE